MSDEVTQLKKTIERLTMTIERLTMQRDCWEFLAERLTMECNSYKSQAERLRMDFIEPHPVLDWAVAGDFADQIEANLLDVIDRDGIIEEITSPQSVPINLGTFRLLDNSLWRASVRIVTQCVEESDQYPSRELDEEYNPDHPRD